MKKENITTVSLADVLSGKIKGKTDWERVHREVEAGIEPEPDPDEGSFDLERAQTNMPRPKKHVSIRLDPHIVEFFKAQGHRGYQTRINAVLDSYVQTHKARTTSRHQS